MNNLPATVPVEAVERMAVAVAKSGLFGVKTPDQAMALMLIAQAEGLHPAIAARDYHVINGRPALKADAMLARFQANGGSVKWTAYTDERVAAVISHPQGGSVEIEWTLKQAERAGLTKNPTWRQYPRQMLRSRVISEGVRTVFPGVAVGALTVEEVNDMAAQPRSMREVAIEQPEQSGALAEVLAAIETATDEAALTLLRPRVRELGEDDRKVAIAAGIARANALKAAQAEIVDAEVQEVSE